MIRAISYPETQVRRAAINEHLSNMMDAGPRQQHPPAQAVTNLRPSLHGPIHGRQHDNRIQNTPTHIRSNENSNQALGFATEERSRTYQGLGTSRLGQRHPQNRQSSLFEQQRGLTYDYPSIRYRTNSPHITEQDHDRMDIESNQHNRDQGHIHSYPITPRRLQSLEEEHHVDEHHEDVARMNIDSGHSSQSHIQQSDIRSRVEGMYRQAPSPSHPSP